MAFFISARQVGWPYCRYYPDRSMSDVNPNPSSKELDLEAETQLRIAELEEELSLLDADRRAIRDREARFKILSELVTDCCWARWRSADGAVERAWVNEAFTQLTGYTPEEFEQVGREGLVHPEDLEKIRDFIDGPIGVSEHEFRIIRKDGEVRWLHERLRVQEEDGGIEVFGATRDVTVQKQAEQVLRASNRELELRVTARTAELREVNQQLREEVEERRKIEAELRHSKAFAEQSSEAKSRFLATMTHELRTPLHGIVCLIELLQQVDLPTQADDWMRALQASAESLSKLVEEVLDFSKIEAEQLALETQPFSLRKLASQLRDMLVHRANQRDIHLEMAISNNLPARVEGDGARLHQILLNLLDNAVKFTDRGSVTLVMERVADRPSNAQSPAATSIRFEVIDTGIGFNDEAQKHIFDPFTQADASTTRRFGGSGLGLAISRRLVELLQGSLDVESTPGVGTTFTFTLPFSLTTSQERRVADRTLIAANSRILVAEDNPVNQIVIREQLESLDVEVVMAPDGRQALEALGATSFDALLLDCHMPEMDGFETARQIRAAEEPEIHLPIIAITASAIREELEACREAGMDDILTKPYRRQDLAEMLVKWLPSKPEPSCIK